MDISDEVFAYLREEKDNKVFCIHNVTNKPLTLDIELSGISASDHVQSLLKRSTIYCKTSNIISIELKPYEFEWIRI
ncbi:MAG: alpha-glucosidase C-terminal domain-containing protein [Halanaerobiales bacterium]|nr:alpha-glucosidase C-terminal domain-containing protein [Halanaerobiales bacterium]